MYGFVYMTTNELNGRKYIGQRKYYKGWKTYLGSGTSLKESINKYGSENFSRVILEEATDAEHLNRLEEFYTWIHDAVADRMYYNRIEGGTAPDTTGRKLSEEHKEKIRISSTGRYHTEESKTKMSMIKKAQIALEGAGMQDKKHTEETKKKMSESMTGIPKTDIAKKNIGQSVRDRSPNVFLDGVEFNSMMDLSEYLIENNMAHSTSIGAVKTALRRAYNGNKLYNKKYTILISKV